ncbi:hypothetical protein [Arthrobacter sp. MMS18-M83]|uniref:hypothetical protein n=1 Tax=Arthrobacter sp. MMS18-M83 TaxID=2996261 RepID=UPI00227B12C1|nr:hypothetical protein [Arthrobacter sp. MMS18-M83]WAH98484.1 hypothetical protein OW521_06430 [Arthrobacter sp. MMS18-M83]
MINDESHTRLFAPSEAVETAGWRAELRNDELSDITFNGIPVLRAIRAVVRDHDWRTLVPTVSRVAQHARDGGVTLLLDIDFAGSGSGYTGELAIHLMKDSVKVTFDGLTPTAFRSNRIGLVVLHRPDDAGRAVTIGSPGGASTPSFFPTDISPHQPFLDIASMEWERDGTGFRLDFHGDVFETEDQRNWTDASFKTYGTPLSKPFPVEVSAGDRVHQSVLLTALPGPVTEPGTLPVREAVLTVLDGVTARVPALSVSASSTSATASRTHSEPIPGLDALLLELTPGTEAERSIRRAKEEAAALDVPLDVRLSVDSPDRIGELLELLPLDNVVRLAAFSASSHVTEPDLWDGLSLDAGRRGFTGTLLSGARSHFTELNRNAGILPPGAPALTFSITPQMHATEVPHLVETLPMQRLAALNALRIASGRPLHLGPVTLKARFNAVATVGEDAAAEAMATDPLQPEPFTAAWMLGSIAALSVPGVESVSYFEATGPRGIRGPGGLTPAGELLAALAGVRGCEVLDVAGEVPGVVLYPVRDGGRTVLFAANLTAKPLSAVVRLPAGDGTDLELEPWTAVVRRFD